jgi:tetratricopeptide (TPR) repeat protein
MRASNILTRVGGRATVTQVGRDLRVDRQVILNVTPEQARGLVRAALDDVSIWNIPLPVRSFAGRETELHAIHRQLESVGAAALVPATTLHGTAGVGKSQLALAYAEAHRAEYRLGWWVSAETELEIVGDLARLAEMLGLEGAQVDKARAVIDALHQEDGWLLIFDNASPQALDPFLPRIGKGAVIITSRNPSWPEIPLGLPVDVLPIEVAVELLLRVSEPADRDAAKALATELGCLPLALQQAASFMAAPPKLGIRAYLELFLERRAELLKLGRAVAYKGTVDATCSIAVRRLKQQDPAAVRLLELFAFMAPDAIPVELLAGANVVPGKLRGDPLVLHTAVTHLLEAGLLTEETSGTLRMHRLVQDVVRAHLRPETRRARVVEVVDMVLQAMPDSDDPAKWPAAKQLLPHARAVLAHGRNGASPREAMIDLASAAANIVSRLGLGPRLAVDLDTEALEFARRLHPGDDPKVAVCLGNLAAALHEVNELQRARDLDEQALAIFRKHYQGDHPDVAWMLANLGAVEGLEAGAREFDEEALAMRRRLFPGGHLDLAWSLQNVAAGSRASGDIARARELDAEALAILRRLYPGDHPEVARSLGNLAIDLHKLGALKRARQLDEEALAMARRLFPGDHMEVADSLCRLASDLHSLRMCKKSRSLLEEAVPMLRRLIDFDHPRLAISISDLALETREASQSRRARTLDKEALAMFRRLHCGDHLDVAYSLDCISLDLRAMGHLKRARRISQEAMAMRRRLDTGVWGRASIQSPQQ